MYDFKLMLGVSAAVISVISYIPYIRNCIKNKTKPNAYSWTVWTIITSIAFFAHFSSGAGAGSYVWGVTILLTLIILFFSFKNKNKVSKIDVASFILALIAIVLWQVTDVALYAIIFVLSADALGFFITFRKTYFDPYSETLSMYAFAAVKFTLAFLALETYSPTTYLYPIYLIIANTCFVLMTYIRRKGSINKRV